MDFFEELEKLRKSRPRISAVRLNNINSDYTANTDQLKNCYLIANAVKMKTVCMDAIFMKTPTAWIVTIFLNARFAMNA